jgi:ribonucleoside-diphosphate reductase beta chain
MSKPSILDPGFALTLRPMRYPQFYDMYRDAISNTWSVEEIDLASDIGDLRDRLSSGESHLIKRLVAFFATGDTIVANNLVINLYKHINAPEARMYLSRQLFEEAQHIQFYLTLLDTYVPDEDERAEAFSAIEHIPSLRAKAAFCFKWIDSIQHIDQIKTDAERRDFLMVLITFAAAVEGLFFFAAFAYVYFLRSRGLCNGLAAGTNWVFRDESCVLPDTQVLTPHGWVAFPDLSEEDIIAQFDMTTSEISFIEPIRLLSKPYKGKIYRFFSRKGGIDQAVTQDHDIVQKWDYQETWTKVKAVDFKLNGKKQIPVGGQTRITGRDLSAYERFLIALQADGTLPGWRHNGSRCGTVPVRFSLTKERKKERLERILSELGWNYVKNGTEKVAYRVSVPLEFAVTKDFNSWVDPSTRSMMWCESFIDEVARWDGHIRVGDTGTVEYVTTVEMNADIVQTVALLSGKNASKSRRVDDRKESYKDCFHVLVVSDLSVSCNTLQQEVTDYEGMVYCATVPTGAIVIRRNDKVSITGNCHMNFAFATVEVIRAEHPHLFDEALEKRVRLMLDEAVSAEALFTEDVLGKGVSGFPISDMRQYLQYVADQRLAQLGYAPSYGVRNPLDFMLLQDVQELSNFFERRVTSYSTGVTGAVRFDEAF